MKPTLALLSLVSCLLSPVFLPAARADSAKPGRTDPNAGLFPDSSVVDFSYLQDAPAGKYGFLTTDRNGHFVWPNGKRARFWGVNISNRSVWVPKETIDRVVDVLARAGANMVRFEALDSTGALTDMENSDSSRLLDEKKLKTLDYWISRVRARGMYYYLDLLDFRQFKVGDEVPAYQEIGRAAKPYAFFDRRLIDLQKEYAEQLLTHRNVYTGLRYVDDPALALLEICNEHGLFMKAASLDSLVPPYRAELGQQWNRWLMQQYGSRDALKAAWGSIADTDVLRDGEDPSAYSVDLPNFAPDVAPAPNPDPNAGATASGVAYVDGRRAPTRLRDGVRFLYETQRAYFREMKAALRAIGLKVPITGVVSNDIVPDVASAAAECDFTSENYYYDHPAFAGKEWEGMFFYNDTDPLRYSSTYQIAPWLGALRWDNKPVVVREWATVWPNRYRAVAIPEMAAYASLQDFDAVLLFGYQVERDPERLSDFDHQADPTVWGLFGLAAQTFLRTDIAPAPYSATIAYTPDTLFRWPNDIGNLHRLAWFVRLNSTLTNGQTGRQEDRETRDRGRRGAIRNPQSASRNSLVISAANSSALPAIVDQFHRMGAPVASSMLSTGMMRASTGQVLRNTGTGILKIETPRTVAICGELPLNKPITAGDWTLVSPTGIGALMVVSLDGKPLSSSKRYVVKMVSRAENTDQDLEPAAPGAPGKFHLKRWGKAPVLTFGRPSQAGGTMTLKRGKTTVAQLALEDGTWELVVRGGQATLVCDTPNIRGALFGRSITTLASAPVTVSLGETRAATTVTARRPARAVAQRAVAQRATGQPKR